MIVNSVEHNRSTWKLTSNGVSNQVKNSCEVGWPPTPAYDIMQVKNPQWSDILVWLVIIFLCSTYIH